MINTDQIFMREALKLARQAGQQGEVPVGAVITFKSEIIARAHNQVELLKDPTAHAEMIAITQATSTLGNKWLNECCLYVTVEPCSMCAGALVLARIQRLCFGAWDAKTGACGSVLNIVRHNKLNHRVQVASGVEGEVCGKILSEFFRSKRESKKRTK